MRLICADRIATGLIDRGQGTVYMGRGVDVRWSRVIQGYKARMGNCDQEKGKGRWGMKNKGFEEDGL